jgi:hypothetical protein
MKTEEKKEPQIPCDSPPPPAPNDLLTGPAAA